MPTLSADALGALILFAAVTTFTPGPNTLMLMASGANFGVRRTVPHMLGILIGFAVMILLVGIGVMGVFEAFPEAETALKVASVAYLLWLAWKIANAAPPQEGAAAGQPMTFLQAALFQWVNPKAWSMALSAIAVYAPSRSLAAVALVALVFALVTLPAVGCWSAAGQQMRRWLAKPGRLRLFNRTMALLLVASLWPVVAP
ncbi:MAG: LysE family translocator [Pseudomonadota bacterium]